MTEFSNYQNCPWCQKLHDDGVWLKKKDASGMVFICHECAEDHFAKTPKPIFKRGDLVRFSFGKNEKRGEIEIVDFDGATGIKGHSYDIFVEEENMLYKHVRESGIFGLI